MQQAVAGFAQQRLAPLASRVVIVTGAARGLGRAIAKGCAAAGAKVVLADREAAEVEAA